MKWVGIAHTTGYQTHVQPYAAALRLEPIRVAAASFEDTVAILRMKRPLQEQHHAVRIEDTALNAAARLAADHPLTDRLPRGAMPGRAYWLLAAAASALAVHRTMGPLRLMELRSSVQGEEIAVASLSRDVRDMEAGIFADHSETRRQLAEAERQLANLRSELESLEARWENEKRAQKRLQELRSRHDELQRELNEAQRRSEFERASKLLYEAIPELEAQIRQQEQGPGHPEGWLVPQSVGPAEVAAIVSQRGQ